MKQIKVLTTVLCFVFLCACDGGSTTGNPVTFKVNGSSQDATVAKNDIWHRMINFFVPTAVAAPANIEDSAGRIVVLSEFWTTLGEIEFKATESADAGEVDGEEVEFEGPYTFDVLVTAVDPIGTVHLNMTSIRRIKVKLIRTENVPAGAPAGLATQSLIISGTVDGVAFTLTSQDEAVIEVAGPNPVELASNSKLLLQIKIADIFKKMDLGAISVPTNISESNRVNVANPCPTIDASANDLYTCFRKGIETEANFGRDNGDDELDGSDDTVR